MDVGASMPQVHVVASAPTNPHPDYLDDWVVAVMYIELYKFRNSIPSLQLGDETDSAIVRYKGSGRMP